VPPPDCEPLPLLPSDQLLEELHWLSSEDCSDQPLDSCVPPDEPCGCCVVAHTGM
jgi:hypothetical protein